MRKDFKELRYICRISALQTVLSGKRANGIHADWKIAGTH